MGEGVSNGAAGRWPANVMHDGSDEVVGLFPETKARGNANPSRTTAGGRVTNFSYGPRQCGADVFVSDSGSAARFFYCAKASKRDRDEGLEGMERKPNDWYRDSSGLNKGPNERVGGTTERVMPRNHHPTVKPTDLMRYLCRLITPPGGVVLDPFMGSGSTGKAAVLEGFGFVGIEKEAEYLAIAERRIEHARMQPSLLAEAAE